ncbi:MAG TPA: hypothetical protein VMG34_03625 [Bacteroidota bacterium]|nr:hypothetical protein [Bacteroidota bacterium]
MSVQGVSGSTNPYLSNLQGGYSSAGSAFKNLVSALQSGNLTGAQGAYSALQNLFQGSGAAQSSSSKSSSPEQSQVSADFAALGNALQSGNLSAAQDAMKKLAQDAQSSQRAHRHHHHHHGSKAASNATAPSSTSTDVTATSGSTGSAGTNIDTLL